MIENDMKLLEHCVLDLQHRVQALEKKIKQTQRRVIVLECKADRKTEPQTERAETMSCQECKWWFTDSLKHGGYCQSLLYNHECRYEPEVDCSWK